jgi:CRP/FNR family transcriptional regulator, anaerobic regulatory protein
MDERLVFYLKRHQEKTGSNILTSSITEIAQELNSSREVISRLLRKLSESGTVELHRSHIEIHDLSKVLA